MDGQQFDGIARLLAGGRSRRNVLKGIVGLMAGAAAVRTLGTQAAASDTTCTVNDDCGVGGSCGPLVPDAAGCAIGDDVCGSTPNYSTCYTGGSGGNCYVYNGSPACLYNGYTFTCTPGPGGDAACVTQYGVDYVCVGGSNCGSGACQKVMAYVGTCTCLGQDESCSADADCCSDFSCSGGSCKRILGGSCSGATDCAAGLVCDSGVCKIDLNGSCISSGDCATGSECSGGSCKRSFNASCTSTADCAPLFECDVTTSTCRIPIGGACEGGCVTGAICCCTDSACAEAAYCVAGDCCSSGNGENQGTCDAPDDTCIQNVCTPPNCLGLGETCSDDSGCCDGTCNAGICQNGPDEFCLRDIDCTSGLCVDSEDPDLPCDGTDNSAALCVCAFPKVETSTVTVHMRCCPEGATDVFGECHGNPLAGVAVALSNGETCVTDESGNCSLLVFSPDPVTISDDTGATLVGVYCALSDAVGEETFINEGMTVAVPDAFTEVICDVYYVGMCKKDDGGKKDDDGGKKDDGGDTTMPDTGVGVAANLGGLIAGAAAVAGAAVVLGKVVKPEGETGA